jgi:molybdopterin synthase catalytic subunit
MVRIKTSNFSIENEINNINFKKLKIGAVVSFVGYVRDFYDLKDDSIVSLNLDYYPGMTEKSLIKIEFEAKQKWDLEDVVIIHRIGELKLHDQIVLVVVASKHRGEAFKACEYIINHLKINAPFWKKERSLNNYKWVEQNEKDISKLM